MGLEEVAIGTEGFGCTGHGGHKLAIATRLASCGAGTLHGVRAVHNDAVGPRFHQGDIAEVHHQVVVAINITALGQPHLLSTCLAAFLHGVLHILARKELCLLDIHHGARFGGLYQQIGLATKESRNLQDIADAPQRCCLITFVDISQDGQSVLGLHVGKHLRTALQAWPAKRVDARTVRFVKGGLEVNLRATLLAYAHQFLRHDIQKFGRLYHARSCYKYRIHIGW